MPNASEDYYAKERAYAEVVHAIPEGKYKDVSDAARKSYLNRRVLADRYNGKSSKSTRQAGGKYIIPFLLPPHSTHILQPLDVGVFRAYKQHHGNEIYKAVLRSNVKFDKLAFLGVFQTFRDTAFKSSTIKHAFKRIGILPFNPAVVLDPAKKKHALEVAAARPARGNA
jgi:hypothetical protein